VYRVAYGSPNDLQRQANYNSAAGAGDPRYYARKPDGAPPIVLLIGPPHGQEMEGIVGLVNLLQIAGRASRILHRRFRSTGRKP